MQRPEDLCAPRARAGFTLIEVLAAVLIVSLVFGLLLESVTRNLADLGRARQEARAAAIAEQRVHTFEAELAAGTPLEDGEQAGVFDAPDDDLHWLITVTPFLLPLPEDYVGLVSPSPLFAFDTQPGAPAAPLAPGQVPPLRLVEVRVFPADVDPAAVEPIVFFATAPPDAARLQQLQMQRAQNPQEADRESAATPPAPEPD